MRGVDVAVIGGGAVGVCSAMELARQGASVVLLERGADLAWGCSAGNAGIVGPSHVLPLASPAAVRDGLRWMSRPDSPFYVRPSYAAVPWLVRFTANATPGRVRRSRSVLRGLAIHSAALHASFARAGLDTGHQRAGLLNVYADSEAFREALRDAQRDEHDGIRSEVLTPDDVSAAGAALASPAAGVIRYPDEAHCDPFRFVKAVGAYTEELGVAVRPGVEVLELRRQGERVQSLWTTDGEMPVGEVVVAAGVWTSRFASALGVDIPIAAGKGYHLDVPAADSDPQMPIWLHEDRVVVTPLGGRVRFAGTMELAGLDEAVSRRRVEAIRAAVGRALPALAQRPTLEVWRGLRPCTPDGLPVIGRPPEIENVTLAAGHGMWGLQLAPVTALLVAQLVAGRTPSHDLSSLRPERFGLPRRLRRRHATAAMAGPA
jgi:D-amino-acid dehydrogenase